WNLDHDAYRHGRHRLAAARELRGCAGDRLTRVTDLVDARHERKHDPQAPVARGAQERPNLHGEELGPGEAEAQAAQPEPAAWRRRSASAVAAGRSSSPWRATRARTSGSGSTITSLRVPSMTTCWPASITWLALCSPTTAGTSSDRARIAV